MIKNIYEKLHFTSYLMVRNSKLSHNGQVCPLSPLVFNIILDVLTNAIRKGKIYRLGRKLSLSADDRITSVENLKELT